MFKRTSYARHRLALALSVAFFALAGGHAHATDGYFLNGIGAKAEGEGGVAIALPQDALSIAANPAAATDVGSRLDIGAEIFIPNRSATIGGNGYGLDGRYSGNGANPFVLPDFGYVHAVGDRFAVGIAVYGNGGMNTTYKANPFASFGATGPAGVDLKQIFITPTFAVRAVAGQSFGVSPIIVVQSFKASGIQPFANYSQDPSHFTNLGENWSTGVGVRLGWLGHFGPALTLGAFYQSKVWVGSFSKYDGLFAGQGEFDVPAQWGGGFAVKAGSRLTLAADVKRIEYSDVASVGDALAPLFAGVPFGAIGGPGFGWHSITTAKLGVSYAVAPKLVLRAGYSWNGNPVRPSQTLLNILAPGVVKQHATLGVTWTTPGGVEITGFVMHALGHTVYGNGSIPEYFGGGEADVSLAETSFGLSGGWKF